MAIMENVKNVVAPNKLVELALVLFALWGYSAGFVMGNSLINLKLYMSS